MAAITFPLVSQFLLPFGPEELTHFDHQLHESETFWGYRLIVLEHLQQETLVGKLIKHDDRKEGKLSVSDRKSFDDVLKTVRPPVPGESNENQAVAGNPRFQTIVDRRAVGSISSYDACGDDQVARE